VANYFGHRCRDSPTPGITKSGSSGGKLQLSRKRRAKDGAMEFRIEVADETVPGADLDVTGGTVRAVDEHRPNWRGEWIAHR